MEFPVRKYLHQSLKHWLGRMLSRKDIESWLELSRTGPASMPMKDIFDGLALRRFKDSKRVALFLNGPPGELRIVFSLSVDGFNPFQTKAAGKAVSSTAIYMVCLNLPPHLRYRPENMYLAGVVPGPNKPHDYQINHPLTPLVDELELFWEPGVTYTRTAKRPHGRHSRAAMIPLVCDLVAARQVAGIGAYNHTFMLCSFCGLAQDDIEETDPAHFPPRDLHAHRETAIAWRDATSTQERKLIFDNTGIRWSELLRLEYWNPHLYIVVDSMHNLYLGLLQRHIRDFWGVSVQVDDGDGLGRDSVKAPTRPDEPTMAYARDILLHGSDRDLDHFQKPLLYHIALDSGVRRAGTIKLLLKHIKAWVRGVPLPHGLRLTNARYPSVSRKGFRNRVLSGSHRSPIPGKTGISTVVQSGLHRASRCSLDTSCRSLRVHTYQTMRISK